MISHSQLVLRRVFIYGAPRPLLLLLQKKAITHSPGFTFVSNSSNFLPQTPSLWSDGKFNDNETIDVTTKTGVTSISENVTEACHQSGAQRAAASHQRTEALYTHKIVTLTKNIHTMI